MWLRSGGGEVRREEKVEKRFTGLGGRRLDLSKK